MPYSRYDRHRPRRRKFDVLEMWPVPVFILAIVVFGWLSVATQFGADQWRTCTVTDKDRTATQQQGQSSMRVYTEECGVMDVGDLWLRGIFDSADTYAQIEPGNTYEFRTVGYRVGLFSMFPTIMEVRE